MAAGKISSTPSFFNFLKQGLLLPSHNRRLFATVFTIIAASSYFLLLGNDLAVQPLTDKLDLDTKALNRTDPSSPDFLQPIRKTQDDTLALWLTSTAYLVFSVVIKSAIKIVVVFAAVATYSGELHTFGSLLGKVKTQLKGPVLTLTLNHALEFAFLLVMSTLVMVFMIMKYIGLFFVGSLLLRLVPFVFHVYFSFICSLSVVVAVAEPGFRRSWAGALGRAWRLVRGKHTLVRAMLFISVNTVLGAALTPVYNLAKTCAHPNMAAGLLLGFLYIILTAAVQLFASCAMTAFYYECKEHVKFSTKEHIDALCIYMTC